MYNLRCMDNEGTCGDMGYKILQATWMMNVHVRDMGCEIPQAARMIRIHM